MPVVLREITSENHDAVVGLSVAPEQSHFVSSVSDSMRDAREMPEGKPWYRAIYVDESPVGFVMISWDVVPDPPEIYGPWFLWRLLVDTRYQGRGYGRDAVRLVVDLVRAEGASELTTSCVEGVGGPKPFYLKLGFRDSGERDSDGETVLILEL